jgi:hypothetical protein
LVETVPLKKPLGLSHEEVCITSDPAIEPIFVAQLEVFVPIELILLPQWHS